ncbi:GGDEF domain-containing protein [uncultured Paraglaciecola sp.]|uniref:sensor domain-containing diguanylate cyclase n=1 Tax=uncultured Paraglaciecola sp. TaxID=1765024 RepID=UPI002618F8C1|nr:GGDEF domain-containing protein [uncultured Paraglaciecola sp.]
MQFRRFFQNYLIIVEDHSNDLEASQRVLVANIFGLIGYSIGFIMSLVAFLREDWLLGIILLASSSVLFIIHLFLRSKKIANSYTYTAILFTSAQMLVMLYLVHTGGVNGTGPLWIYLVPPVTLFFGGIRNGIRNLGMFVLVLSLLLFYPNDALLQTSYTFEFKSRLLYSFLTVSCLFWLYEYIRQNSFQQLQELNQQLEKQAKHDALSGLLNRRGIGEELQKEFERSQRYKNALTLMMCDIDYFKKVNDQYGHDMGDTVIKKVAEIFESVLRKQDSLARWGGEEYLFLLPETKGNQGMQLAEKLRSKIENTQFTYKDKSFSITISIGLHQLTSTDTINQAITLADSQLFKAKEQGRNRCILSS